MDIKIEAESVTIDAAGYGRNQIVVSLEGVDTDEILNEIDIDEVISHHGIQDILDKIDVDEVKDHFGLVEEDDR